ncbi:hypothetical protein [Paenibacillus sp. GCM10027626]|uniref:hypothetical protein n=1 Tax=Paenibacillus sp. GCM10027626 TaxID=3273411 RepID=UPI00362D9901
MFRHVFATLHEMLDEIRTHYGQAGHEQKKQYAEQLSMLKSISDEFIEEWLLFEEKMSEFQEQHAAGSMQTKQELASSTVSTAAAVTSPPKESEGKPAIHVIEMSEPEAAAVCKGQGYFKLFMFREAAHHFQEAIIISPENNMARLFLAMTFMHLQEWNEAQRHFQLLVELTEHPKWQALGYNALGCIQAIRMNLEQAELYFLKAHEADPAFADPLSNLKSCQQHAGHLSLYFGSGQL